MRIVLSRRESHKFEQETISASTGTDLSQASVVLVFNPRTDVI